ncbi:macro domain-containing protein [candidate division KSB1 bacterium]|nr:macro domain-containing protein [candidate division KSB1 bacterium]
MIKKKINQSEIALFLGDITESTVDAIVNAANSQLILGGGVAGAIRRKGGPTIQAACDEIGNAEVGTAVVTTAGNLRARHVIHAVGPRMGEGDEDTKLTNATRNSLKAAEELQLNSLAFPAISTGIFGFPLDRAAQIMLATTAEYLAGATLIRQVQFFLFDEMAFEIFKKELSQLQVTP